jgi:hypothetical protein
MTENRSFKMHPEMLFSIIFAQAGTLGKALLELIMNSIDAGASRVDIDLDANSLTVTDDGRGFQSRQEIDDWFETFGTPHKEGDATYGRFRMGRGQIMAFAATQWVTTTFRMDVDVKSRGLDYTLTQGDMVPGCQIKGQLYDALMPSELAAVMRELRDLARYAQIPVMVNGEQINKLPSDSKWDIETEDAYISLKETGSLKVYNLGVFVREYGGHTFGTGGTVVTKRQLEVNFARNDVLVSKCEVWKRLRKYIQSTSTDKITKKPRLTDQEREGLINRFRHGEVPYSRVADVKLITDTQGRHHALSRFSGYSGIKSFTVAPSVGSRIGEAVHTRKLAFVLCPSTLERFGVADGKEFADLLREITQNYNPHHSRAAIDLDFQPFDVYSACLNDGHETLKDSELTKHEMAALTALRRAQYTLATAINACGYEVGGQREVFAGVSDSAEAWTNGINRIVVERSLLRLASDGFAGITRLLGVMVHEYLHRESDTGSHRHDLEFYEAFHEVMLDSRSNPVGVAARRFFFEYVRELRKAGLKANKNILRDQDLEAKLSTYGPIPEVVSA